MNGYICFWKGKRVEVYANTSLEAQNLAAVQLRVKRPYEITVMLAEKAGEPVVHVADF